MNIVIAVLSTIVLAATLLTLILSIIAYIVYKVRERKFQALMSQKTVISKKPEGEKNKESPLLEQYSPESKDIKEEKKSDEIKWQ